MQRKWFVGLAVILMVIGLASVALATDPVPGTSEAGIVPVESLDDNPLRGDGADNHKIDLPDPFPEPDEPMTGTIEIPCNVKLEDLGSGYPDISEKEKVQINYVVSDDGKSLYWESQDKVELVVVKGGNAANLYYYYDPAGNYLGLWNIDTEVWYDSGLQAPINEGGNIPEISNFGFFARCPGTPPPTNGNGTPPPTNGNGTPPPTNGNGTPPPAYIIPYLPTKPITATPLVALPQTSGNYTFLIFAGLLLVAGLGVFFASKPKHES